MRWRAPGTGGRSGTGERSPLARAPRPTLRWRGSGRESTCELGDRVGAAPFDPIAAWFDDDLVHVRRIGPQVASTLRAEVSAMGPAELTVRPRAVRPAPGGALVVTEAARAVPLSVLAGLEGWLDRPVLSTILHDLARAVRDLHARGGVAGWVGPDAVLVDAFGRARLDLSLSLAHRRPGARAEEDDVAVAVLVGWVASVRRLELGSRLADLLDEAVVRPPGTPAPTGWLDRVVEQGQDAALARARPLGWGAAGDGVLLDAIDERWRATVLAAPDRPRRGGLLSAGPREPRRRSGGR